LAHPAFSQFDIAERGVTGILLEAIKFFSQLAETLVDLEVKGDAPLLFKLDNNLLSFSWSPGLAYDL